MDTSTTKCKGDSECVVVDGDERGAKTCTRPFFFVLPTFTYFFFVRIIPPMITHFSLAAYEIREPRTKKTYEKYGLKFILRFSPAEI